MFYIFWNERGVILFVSFFVRVIFFSFMML